TAHDRALGPATSTLRANASNDHRERLRRWSDSLVLFQPLGLPGTQAVPQPRLDAGANTRRSLARPASRNGRGDHDPGRLADRVRGRRDGLAGAPPRPGDARIAALLSLVVDVCLPGVGLS